MATPIIAANAYAALSRLRDPTNGPAAGIANGLGNPLGNATAGGPGFSSVLKDVIDAVSAAGARSDAQAQAVASGKANMVDVVTAVTETETAFQTLVSVRDKVIAAYEDVLKMQI